MGRNGPRTIWPIAFLIQLYGPETYIIYKLIQKKPKKSNNSILVDPIVEDNTTSSYIENFTNALKAEDTKRQYPVRLKYFLDSVYMEEPKTEG